MKFPSECNLSRYRLPMTLPWPRRRLPLGKRSPVCRLLSRGGAESAESHAALSSPASSARNIPVEVVRKTGGLAAARSLMRMR